MNAPAVPQYLSAFEVAARLSCSYHKALKVMREAGAIKIGALVRIDEARLRSYLTQCPALDRPASTSAPVARAGTATSTTGGAGSASRRRTGKRRTVATENISNVVEFSNWRPARGR